MQLATVLAFVLAGRARGAAFRGAFQSAMQPDVAARTFAALEDKWSAEAQKLLRCEESNATDCGGVEAFQRSCGVVVKAVVQGSSGDKQAVSEYMGTVCGQTTLKGWKGEDCRTFAQSLDASMSDSQYQNRENLNATALCGSFWQKLSAQEGKRMAAARAARAVEVAEAARRAAEEEKRVAEMNAQKVEVEKKAQAEAARAKVELAKRSAEKAEDAMREVEAKKDEAMKAAEDAKVAMENARTQNSTSVPTTNATNTTNFRTIGKAANSSGVSTARNAVNATPALAGTNNTTAANAKK